MSVKETHHSSSASILRLELTEYLTAFLHTSKLLGSSNFELCLHSLDIQTNSEKLTKAPDLSNVPFKYHKFTDIFSKIQAEVLTSYHPYNLKINLEDVQSPVGPIYFLLAFKQKTFKEFIEENLNMGFIQPHFHMVYWSYSLRRKIVHCTSVLTSVVLTASPRRIIIHFCLSSIY